MVLNLALLQIWLIDPFCVSLSSNRVTQLNKVMLPWAKFSVHSIAKEWRTGPSPHHFFSSPVHSKILLWYVFASDGEVPKIPLNSNSSDFHYTKTMKHWKCRVILSMKVNINCMKLNNSYQSSLSSLSASLNKMFLSERRLWLSGYD